MLLAKLEDWPIEQQAATGLAPFSAGGLTLTPTMARYRDVTVTGLDWLAIRGDEVAILTQAPHLYFAKNRKRNLRKTPDGIEADLGTVRHLPGTSILIGGSPNYYHWLVIHLSKLLLARKLIEVPRILINRPAQFQIESLALLGIAEWEEVGEDESVRCDDLWIVTGLDQVTLPHPALIAMLREAFPPRPLPRRRLYLSRRDAHTRNLVNEDELIGALDGFDIVTASLISFQRQVDLFASADEVLAVHGAGMANVAFCRPGTVVHEIFTPLHKVTSMQLLAKVGGLKHQFIPARNVSVGADGNPLLGDLEIDVGEVLAKVAR